MSGVRISVVVPTIGRVDSLGRCLDALLEGAETPAEIVVVDQSEGLAVARAVAGRRSAVPALIHVPMERRGLSAARNAGMRVASGGAIAFTDDDCLPDNGWIAALTRAFEKDDALAAVTGPMLPLGAPDDATVAVSSRTSMERRTFRGHALPWSIGTGGNTTIRRAWIERLGGYDERLGVGARGGAGEDLDLFRRLVGAGGTVLYDPEVVCRHEQKTPAERRARRASYGRGAGTAIGLWLRDGEPRALVALVRWISLRVRMASRGSGARDEARVLAGTVRGVVHGLALRPWQPR